MKRTKAFDLLHRPIRSDPLGLAADGAGYTLYIAGVYQDSVTQDWAMQNCRRAKQLAGEERVRNTWYDVHSLSDPKVFLNAVRDALVADVIMVSVYAADELPLDLYVWVQAWLPRRLLRAGALTAFIGVAEPPDYQFFRTVEYLQAVASKAQLDFIPQERMRPVASAAPYGEPIEGRCGATAQALQQRLGRRFDV
jgi:hypothetical protein